MNTRITISNESLINYILSLSGPLISNLSNFKLISTFPVIAIDNKTDFDHFGKRICESNSLDISNLSSKILYYRAVASKGRDGIVPLPCLAPHTDMRNFFIIVRLNRR